MTAELTASSPGVRDRLRLVPTWAWVVAIYIATRVLTTIILLAFASAQELNPWTGPSPAYADFAGMWDGRWYNIIAATGYPSVLPMTDDGLHVRENAWAFMPVYPAVVSAVMFLTGLAWNPASVVVSVAAGLGAAIVFARTMEQRIGRNAALFAATLLCVAPVSPLFQLGYAESLQLFLLALALHLLMQRRYALLFPLVLVMGFTRPTGLAFSLALVFHVVHRWWRRRAEPVSGRELGVASGLAVWSGLVGLAWPGIAWLVTGSMTAYTDTELAWRSAYIGYQHLIPFAAWFQGLNWWFGVPLGAIVVILLMLLLALILSSRRVRVIGADNMFWVAAYSLYLLAVFFPQSSTFRLLAPLFPLLGALAVPRAWWFRVALVALCIWGQVTWIHIAWFVDGQDWTPP